MYLHHFKTGKILSTRAILCGKCIIDVLKLASEEEPSITVANI
jgi:hypothetical protein